MGRQSRRRLNKRVNSSMSVVLDVAQPRNTSTSALSFSQVFSGLSLADLTPKTLQNADVVLDMLLRALANDQQFEQQFFMDYLGAVATYDACSICVRPCFVGASREEFSFHTYSLPEGDLTKLLDHNQPQISGLTERLDPLHHVIIVCLSESTGNRLEFLLYVLEVPKQYLLASRSVVNQLR